MARKASARVELNRRALTELEAARGEGVERIAQTIIAGAHPPDATPFGQGLVTHGGWLIYNGGKKIGGGSLRGIQPRKPRGARSGRRGEIVAIVGFGFPGKFQELGTVHHSAQPFLWPQLLAVIPRIPTIMRPAIAARMGRRP